MNQINKRTMRSVRHYLIKLSLYYLFKILLQGTYCVARWGEIENPGPQAFADVVRKTDNNRDISATGDKHEEGAWLMLAFYL